MTTEPPDSQPLTMTDSAVALHEMFVSLVAAGFAEHQALHLVGRILLRAGQGPGKPEQ